jgi:Leucine-rich repeat (LRR) protein
VEIFNLPKLNYFHANNCQLTDVRISNCPNIDYLNVANNLLTNTRFLNYLNPEKLNVLSIHTNNFTKQDLEFLNKFSELKNLFLDNADQTKFKKGIYNKFYGSLQSLQNLTKLEILSIGNTDVDDGLECLPDSFRKIGLTAVWQAETSCSKILQELEKASRLKGVTKKLKQREGNDPAWFDDYYRIAPWREAQELFGEEFNERLQEVEIISENEEFEEKNVQKWLEDSYPKNERKERVFLNINDKNLTGELDLSDFVNLEKLECSNNQITELNLSNCRKLTELNCSNNQLEDIIGIKSCSKLVSVNFDKNNFSDSTLKEIKLVTSEGSWKKKIVGEWLNKEYPNDGECLGIFDLENKGRKRKEIEELDISGEELEGELNLEGFEKLKYLNCRNNKLTGINFSNCSNLEVIDCRGNEINNLRFVEKGTKKNLSCLKEFHGSANQLTNNVLENLLNNIGSENLTYLDIGNNNINSQIPSFNSFSRLETLYVGGNKFSGTWEGFENLWGLLEIDVSGNDIEIEGCFKQNKKSLPRLEKIYHDTSSEEILAEESENSQPWKKYYNKEGSYYDFKSFQSQDLSEISEIETILKTPILSEEKGNKTSRINENYEVKGIDYYSSGKVIYPSKNEKWFEWEVGEPLPLSKLPLRLAYISEKGEKQSQIEIRRRIECADEVKHYAILSYSWGGKHREDIKWSIRDAEERLSPGGKKSLDKALKTLEILNCFHLREGKEKIKYLWMDQLCVNQNNNREKSHEIPKMREYYGNSAVTLVAIHSNVGEDNIRKLIKSFEKGEGGLIYPNEIIKNSLPILEKIIGSEWFSRSWTFQEGFLSKQTIFMFDDFLIDGRFMALIWKLRQFSEAHYEECKTLENLCREKVATPVGWSYYKDREEKGYSYRDKASLRLNEALWVIKDRGRALPLDGIYSIIGLLPYGDKVKVDYGKEPESVLREVMLIAAKNGYGEPLSWHGSGSKKPGLCWVPEIDRSGSSNVTGTIKTNYLEKKSNFMSSDNLDKGLLMKAFEYPIAEKSSGIYKLGKEETVDGGLWMRKVLVDIGSNQKERLTLAGTKKGIEAVGEGRILVIPDDKEWESVTPFAVLALVVGEPSKNVRHRIDLVRIEEGYNNLITIKKSRGDKEVRMQKVEGKEITLGISPESTRQYHAQIEVPPKK